MPEPTPPAPPRRGRTRGRLPRTPRSPRAIFFLPRNWMSRASQCPARTGDSPAARIDAGQLGEAQRGERLVLGEKGGRAELGRVRHFVRYRTTAGRGDGGQVSPTAGIVAIA